MAVFLPLLTKFGSQNGFLPASAEGYERGKAGKEQSRPCGIDQQAAEGSQDNPQIHGVAHNGKWAVGNQLLTGKQLCAKTGRDEVVLSQRQRYPAQVANSEKQR